jgi:hypothetical protein
MPRCWTCRRRRLKCDGTLPHCSKCLGSGVECLGYSSVRPLTWVEGIAVRGPMKNRSFGELLAGPQPHSQSQISTAPTHPASTRLMSTAWDKPMTAGEPGTWTWDSSTAAWVEPVTGEDLAAMNEYQYQVTPSSLDIPLSLTEPIFQDLDYTSRFLVDYCISRRPSSTQNKM